MISGRGTLWHASLLPVLALLAGGCGGGASHGTDAGHDAPSRHAEGGTCEAKASAFRDFVAAHRDCASDAECAVVGDCGPNADFEAVRAENADTAYALQVARCETTWDGPLYDAKCSAGRCTLVERTNACCGCASTDGGR